MKTKTLLSLLALLPFGTLTAATMTWNGESGDWRDSTWTATGGTPATSYPSGLDIAVINNNQHVTITEAEAITALQMSGTSFTNTVTVDGSAGGNLTISGASYIGFNLDSYATLALIDDGNAETAELTTTGNITIGRQGNARFQIGTGALARITGQLLIGDPTTASSLPRSSEVTVNGVLNVSSLVTVGSGGAIEATAGKGAFNINGGSVTSGAGTSTIGHNIASVGTVVIENNGTWTTNGALTVGNQGSGTLELKTGGALTVTNGVFTVGQSATSAGTMDILAGSSLTTINATLGQNMGAEGTVTVNGHNARWNTSGAITVGQQGVGHLEVSNGGTVTTATNQNLIIGNGYNTPPSEAPLSNGTGTVEVTGTGSKITIGRELIIGHYSYGEGFLTIDQRGAVESTFVGGIKIGVSNLSKGQIDVLHGTLSASIGAISIGGNAGSEGILHIGSQGTVSAATTTTVGNEGKGTLTIATGGLLTSTGNSNIATNAAAIGSATVAGTWSTGLILSVGNQGKGTLTVAPGGIVTTANLHVGLNGGEGEITLSGDTSSRGRLNVNPDALTGIGAGNVMLANHANAVKGVLNIGGAEGSVATRAGLLNAALVSSHASASTGAARLNFNHTDSNFLFQNAGGANINIQQKVAVHVYSGTTTFGQSTNNYSGGTTLHGGTLLVNTSNGSGLGTGAVSISGGTLGGHSTSAARITGDIALNAGGNIAPGATPGAIGTLQASNLTWNEGGTITLQLGATHVESDLLALNGAFTNGSGGGLRSFNFLDGLTDMLVGETYTLVNFGSSVGFDEEDFTFSYLGSLGTLDGDFVLNGNNLQFTITSIEPIPEPGLTALLILGAGMMGFRRFRKR